MHLNPNVQGDVKYTGMKKNILERLYQFTVLETTGRIRNQNYKIQIITEWNSMSKPNVLKNNN